MPANPKTTEARLNEMIGQPRDGDSNFVGCVEAFMASATCPCDRGKTCQWPRCPQTGNGIGHYP